MQFSILTGTPAALKSMFLYINSSSVGNCLLKCFGSLIYEYLIFSLQRLKLLIQENPIAGTIIGNIKSH